MQPSLNSIAFITCLLLNASASQSQSEQPVRISPSPCKEFPQLKQFDFWLGHWQVTLANGNIAGVNTITKEQKGCVLVENWQGVRGGSGVSFNYFDQRKQQWVQIWTGSEGSQIHIEGGPRNGSMVLEGDIATVGQDGRADFRGTWTPLEDGRVRQFFEQYDAEKKQWVPWFEGFYSKVAEEKVAEEKVVEE